MCVFVIYHCFINCTFFVASNKKMIDACKREVSGTVPLKLLVGGTGGTEVGGGGRSSGRIRTCVISKMMQKCVLLRRHFR